MQKRNRIWVFIFGLLVSIIMGLLGYMLGSRGSGAYVNDKVVFGIFDYNILVYVVVLIIFVFWLFKILITSSVSGYYLGLLTGGYMFIGYERIVEGGVLDYLISYGIAYNVVDLIILYAVINLIRDEYMAKGRRQ